MKKLTKAKARYFIADEAKAAKEYAAYGFHAFAKDERRHMKYFRKKERRL